MSDTDYTPDNSDDQITTGAIPDQSDQSDQGPQYPADYYQPAQQDQSQQQQPAQSDQQQPQYTQDGDPIVTDPAVYDRAMQQQQFTPHGDPIVTDPAVYDRAMQQQGPDQTDPDNQTTATGASLRALARGIGPVTGGIIGGVGVGAALAPAGGLPGLAVGTAAGFGITSILQGIEDKAADALGLSDPHALLGGEWGGLNPFNPKLQQEDDMQHATAVGLGNVATAVGALRSGNAGPMTRLIAGGVFGASEAASQYIQTGKVDWAVVAASAGLGAALPGVAGHTAPVTPGEAPAAEGAIPDLNAKAGASPDIRPGGVGADTPEFGGDFNIPNVERPGVGGDTYNDHQNAPDVQAEKQAQGAHSVTATSDAVGTATAKSPPTQVPNLGQADKYSGTTDGRPVYAKGAPAAEAGAQVPGEVNAPAQPVVNLDDGVDPAVKGVMDSENPAAGMTPAATPAPAAQGATVTPAQPNDAFNTTQRGGFQFMRTKQDPNALRAASPATQAAEAPANTKGLAPEARPPIEPDRAPLPGEPGAPPVQADFHPDTGGLPLEARPPIEPDRPIPVTGLAADDARDFPWNQARAATETPTKTAGFVGNEPTLEDLTAKTKPASLSAGATPAAQRVGLVQTMKDAWDDLKSNDLGLSDIRKIFSPQTVSKEAGEASNIARQTSGQKMRFDTQNMAKLANAQKIMNTSTPEDALDAFLHMEDGQMKAGNPFRAIADDVKAVTDNYWGRIEKLPQADQINYVEGFWPRSGVWVQDEANQQAFRTFLSNQGNNAALKARKFLNPAEAMNAGMKIDPSMLRPDGAPDMMKILGTYMKRTGTYLDTQEMLKSFTDPKMGIAHMYDATQADGGILPNEIKLEGRTYRGKPVYADPDVARIFNNFWSPGIHGNEEAGNIYDTWMKGKNAVSELKLLGLGYHTLAIGGESMMVNAATGMSQIASGDIAKGLATIAKSPNLYGTYKLGARGAAAYEKPGADPMTDLYVGALEDAGITMNPRQSVMQNPDLQTTSGYSNFVDSIKQGSLNMEKEAAMNRIRAAADKNLAPGQSQTLAYGKAGVQVGKEAFGIVGKTMQTAMYPLFNNWVPMMKNGVMLTHMAAWDAAHPTASYAELVAAGRKIGDNADNALGMMHQNNIFWNRVLKQIFQATTLSWSWQTGSARGIIGGALKLARSPKSFSIGNENWDPRAAYSVTMPALGIVMAAMYQLVKTGKMPDEPSLTGKTGGTAFNSNQPESAVLPGYMKDMLGVWNNILNPKGTGQPLNEVYNKLAPLLQMGIEGWENKDWASHPIWNPQDPTTKKLADFFHHVAMAMMPIAAEQGMSAHKGSNISLPERLVGIRAAPAWVDKPQATQRAKAIRDNRDWQQKLTFDKRMAQ